MADEGFAPGALIAGKLRVVRQLGAGGMGAVYEVEHTITKHRRALKVMLGGAHASPALVQRFLREASAAGHIGNPHIVETFDAGTLEDGEPYIVMELLSGEPLSDRIERGPLGLQEAFEIVTQASRGVQAAHDAGIVHRDLKPENLFVVPGEPVFVKILDFGISKFDPTRTGELGLTREGSLMGTPWYMAPEQVKGSENVDGRTDVYALGVVLYECITGKKPFEASHMAELAVKIHEGEFPAPSSVCSANAEVDALVLRAMAREPEDRFQSPAELASAIEALCRRQDIALEATVYAEPPAPSRVAPASKTLVLPEAQAKTGDPTPRDAAKIGATTAGPLSRSAGASEPPARAGIGPLGVLATLAGVALVVSVVLSMSSSGTGAHPSPSGSAIGAEPGASTGTPSVTLATTAAEPTPTDASTANADAAENPPDAAAPTSAPSGRAKLGPGPSAPTSGQPKTPAPKPSASTRSQQQGMANPYP